MADPIQIITSLGGIRAWALGIAGTLLAGVIASWFGHVTTTLRDHDQRIPVMESRQQDQRQQLDRIETKVDKILERGHR